MLELEEVRFEEDCKGCGVRHLEWFCTTREHAAGVIEKYSVWMAANTIRNPLMTVSVAVYVVALLHKILNIFYCKKR